MTKQSPNWPGQLPPPPEEPLYDPGFGIPLPTARRRTGTANSSTGATVLPAISSLPSNPTPGDQLASDHLVCANPPTNQGSTATRANQGSTATRANQGSTATRASRGSPNRRISRNAARRNRSAHKQPTSQEQLSGRLRGIAAGLTVIAVAGLVVASGAATGAAWLQAHPLGQTQIAAGNVELQECTGQAAPDGDWAADLSQADLANLPAWWWQAEQGNASSDVTALAEFKATAGNVIYINQCVKASLQGDNLSAHFKVDWDFSGTDYDTAWQWTSQLANWGIDLQASGWQAVVPAIQAAGDIAAPATSLGQLGQASQDPVVVALDRQVNAPAGASQVSGPDYRVVYWVLQTKLVFQQTVEADNGPVQLPRPRISAYQVRQGGAF